MNNNDKDKPNKYYGTEAEHYSNDALNPQDGAGKFREVPIPVADKVKILTLEELAELAAQKDFFSR